MKRHFLTQYLNPFLTNIGYFNRKIFTLKHFINFTAFLFSAFATVAQSYNNIEFVENKGQWDSRVKYKGTVSNGSFFIRDGGFTVVQYHPVDFANTMKLVHEQQSGIPDDKFMVRTHSFHVDFLGASSNISAIADKPISS
ncbi:MAG: hypothetical protein ACRDEB_07175, partial [Chitinophagaceae bacterium]